MTVTNSTISGNSADSTAAARCTLTHGGQWRHRQQTDREQQHLERQLGRLGGGIATGADGGGA